MDWFNEQISLNSLIWLFFAAFMIHDFEEIVVVEKWMKRNHGLVRSALPKPLRRRFDSFQHITSAQFAVAVALEFIMFIPVTWMAAEHHSFLFFIGFNAVLFIHVFTHLFQSIYLRKYTPGVVTAVFVTLPYSVYLFYRLAELNMLTWWSFIQSLAVGLILIPIVMLGHIIGKKIIPD